MDFVAPLSELGVTLYLAKCASAVAMYSLLGLTPQVRPTAGLRAGLLGEARAEEAKVRTTAVKRLRNMTANSNPERPEDDEDADQKVTRGQAGGHQPPQQYSSTEFKWTGLSLRPSENALWQMNVGHGYYHHAIP